MHPLSENKRPDSANTTLQCKPGAVTDKISERRIRFTHGACTPLRERPIWTQPYAQAAGFGAICSASSNRTINFPSFSSASMSYPLPMRWPPT